MKKLLAAASGHGVPASVVGEVDRAIRAFDEVVVTHSVARPSTSVLPAEVSCICKEVDCVGADSGHNPAVRLAVF